MSEPTRLVHAIHSLDYGPTTVEEAYEGVDVSEEDVAKILAAVNHDILGEKIVDAFHTYLAGVERKVLGRGVNDV